jgi:acetylcholinesterase
MSFIRSLVLATVLSSLATDVAAKPLLPRQDAGPIIDLGYSQYEGIALSSGVNQFLGMRFAAPPLGELRFRAPVNPDVTTGVLQAKAVPPHIQF